MVLDTSAPYLGTNRERKRKRRPRAACATAGLRASLDLNRIGIFGHSLGGAIAANAMANDRRFDAGLNLDGGVPLVLEDRDTLPPPGLSPEQQRALEQAVLAAVASLATRLSWDAAL
jgi:pimeloyl-ACP methyl ester carboxylesterase